MGAARAQQGEQSSGEREVTEVVGRELQLEPVVGQPARRRVHDAGVVDLDVDRTALCEELIRERCDRVERRQVQRAHVDAGIRRALADACRCLLALPEVSDRHDELGAGAGETRGDLESDTVARAGHEGEPSGQVGDDDVEGLRHGSNSKDSVVASIVGGWREDIQGPLTQGSAVLGLAAALGPP